MKLLLTLLTLSVCLIKTNAQVANIKAGVWSDITTWNNNKIPVYADMVVLNFDVVIDINATCKSLNTNGHNVTINSGVILNILGSDSSGIDTSVIFTKKILYIDENDSIIQVFRNNRMNGIKGFLVKERYSQSAPSTTKFTYDNSGQLNGIITSGDSQPSEALQTITLTWDKNKISNIKWVEPGSYGMNRNYYYSTLDDTLSIQYKQNIGRDVYLDSSAVTVFTDTALNKIYKLSKKGAFDYTNIFFNTKGTFYNERQFEYSDKNITAVQFYGQTNYNTTPYAYTIETDSSACNFTREAQVNPFLAAVEEDIFGKEFKMLCYDQTDSIGWILDDYFNSGNWFNTSATRPSQDYYQYENIFNWSLDPITESKINYIVKRDGLVSDQQSGYLYKKLAYTLDAKKRITVIKEYNALTNDLVREIQFSYP